MKKRTKKLLSLLLAIAMILTLAPIAVFAEDEPAPADPVVVEEPAEEPGNGTIMVVVYSKATGDFLDGLAENTDKKLYGSGNTILDAEPSLFNLYRGTGVPTMTSLKNADADAETPELSFVLKASDNTLVSALTLDENAKGSEIVTETITGGAGVSSATALDAINSSRFKVYKASVPAGEYTLELQRVAEPYGLKDTSNRIIDGVVVNAEETTIIGETKSVSGFSERNTGSAMRPVSEKTYKTFDFTGLFLEFRKETRAFSFTTTDVTGSPVAGAEFVMVNRDELLGLLDPVIGVGKEVFTTAIKNLGNPEVFSFEELVKLHTNLLKQNEQGYIALDPEAAYGIIQAYLALLTDADIVGQFIERDENGAFQKLKQPLPAVLSATSDENGVVNFSAANNVTLTWLIQIMLDFGVGTLNGLAGDNALLGFLAPMLQMIQLVMDPDSVDVDSLSAQSFLDLVKGIPGIESNEWVQKAIDAAGSIFGGVVDAILTADVKRSIVNWIHEKLYAPVMDFVYSTLQNYGIVGEKFSNGNYLMFQYKVPVGEDGEALYARNPLVYTLNVKWVEPDNFYVTVADLGLVGPYLAEGFYEFVRNTTYEGPIASALGLTSYNYAFASKVLTGQLDYTKKVNQQIQGAFSAYMADSLYKALGLDLIFKSKTIFLEGMNDYVLENSTAAANLRTYINNQAKKAKAVYTGTVDEDWVFYTLDASPTTTATKLINKSTEDIAAAMPNGSAKQLSVKETGSAVSKIVQRIGTRIEETNAKIVDSIKASITKVFGDIGAKLKDGISKVVSGLFSSIFNGGSNAETPAEDVPVDAGA